jgi:anaerobic ribonucleoside-triphosphate reductase
MKVAVKAKRYIRVVGYYSEVSNLNKGKAQENQDRKCYN